jgi:hypothetical protein
VGKAFRQGDDPWYVGASWPIWFGLNVSFGASFVRSQFLQPDVRETQIFLLTAPDEAYKDRRWTKEILLGVSVDFLNTR